MCIRDRDSTGVITALTRGTAQQIGNGTRWSAGRRLVAGVNGLRQPISSGELHRTGRRQHHTNRSIYTALNQGHTILQYSVALTKHTCIWIIVYSLLTLRLKLY